MDIVNTSLSIAVISILAMGIVLFKHVMFKREILKLKKDMKSHKLENGFDEALWIMFCERTRVILRFKRQAYKENKTAFSSRYFKQSLVEVNNEIRISQLETKLYYKK